MALNMCLLLLESWLSVPEAPTGYEPRAPGRCTSTVPFRTVGNPHSALTLTVTKGDGTRGTISFVEGAPAGRMTRMGLTSADIAVGKPIKAIGAPRRDDPNLYYLKAIILPDGRRFTFAD